MIEILSITNFHDDRSSLGGYGLSFPFQKARDQYKSFIVPSVVNGSYLPIEGWVFGSDIPVTSIAIEWNGMLVATGEVNLGRKDIQNRFPNISVKKPGFLMRCNPEYLPRETEIDLFAILGEGQEKIKVSSIKIRQSPEKMASFEKFFIIFNGRCGSTYLMDLLRQHPQIEGYMETMYQYCTLEQQCSFLDKIFGSKRDSSINAVGFKEQLGNIVEPTQTINYMMNKYAPKIYLMMRKNIVKTAISMIRAKMLSKTHGIANIKDLAQRVPNEHIDPSQLMQTIAYREKLDRDLQDFLKHLNLNTKNIYYEDLLYNKSSFLNELFSDLNVYSVTLDQSSIKKNTSDNLRSAIKNFDEIFDSLKGTQYEDMLLEGID